MVELLKSGKVEPRGKRGKNSYRPGERSMKTTFPSSTPLFGRVEIDSAPIRCKIVDLFQDSTHNQK